MTSIICYNVNGIRSASRKGLWDFFKEHDPDVICLQELKARPEDVDEEIRNPEGYHAYWHSAEKKGFIVGLVVACSSVGSRWSNCWL